MSLAIDVIKTTGVQAGTMLRISRDPAVIQIVCAAGMDCVFVDLEHSAYNWETVSSLILVSRSVGLNCYVRVPELSRAHIGRILDIGAAGVMVPMVSTPEQAKSLVRFAKYPPLGERGLGQMTGQTDYGRADPLKLLKNANEQLLAIAQIETAEGVDQIEEIASTEGIDALFIGPNDLALSLGVPGKLNDDRVQRAISRVAQAAQTHGKLFGMHSDLELLSRWIPHGLDLAISSTDTAMLNKAMNDLAAKIRQLSGKPLCDEPLLDSKRGMHLIQKNITTRTR